MDVSFFVSVGKLGVLTLLIQILGSDIVHLKDDQDTTPVFLAAQQGTDGSYITIINNSAIARDHYSPSWGTAL